MKKVKIIIIFMALVSGVLCFSQCKKDTSCKMKVTCHYSTNGMDADTICPEAVVKFDISKYDDGAVDTNLYKNIDTLANEFGVYEFTYHHPALLIVVASKTDTVKDEDGNVTEILNWAGTAQVELKESETTEKDILLVKVN